METRSLNFSVIYPARKEACMYCTNQLLNPHCTILIKKMQVSASINNAFKIYLKYIFLHSQIILSLSFLQINNFFRSAKTEL